mmetsp:Transcript_103296/g.178014  ORF Transcript_103296/g.178014 Transcript_103296/m.178014 type:complete len:225 (-) Transcript_103296:1419-2093(-)
MSPPGPRLNDSLAPGIILLPAQVPSVTIFTASPPGNVFSSVPLNVRLTGSYAGSHSGANVVAPGVNARISTSDARNDSRRLAEVTTADTLIQRRPMSNGITMLPSRRSPPSSTPTKHVTSSVRFRAARAMLHALPPATLAFSPDVYASAGKRSLISAAYAMLAASPLFSTLHPKLIWYDGAVLMLNTSSTSNGSMTAVSHSSMLLLVSLSVPADTQLSIDAIPL